MAPVQARGGVDLGGTKIQAVVVDEQHVVLGQARSATPTTGMAHRPGPHLYGVGVAVRFVTCPLGWCSGDQVDLATARRAGPDGSCTRQARCARV